MRLRRSTKLTAGAVGAWTALGISIIASTAGAPMPAAAVQLLAAAAFAVSLAQATRTALGVWRGPVITSFPRRDAVLCDPPGADAIRAGAQLRGTMGGAGHVHPARLAFPAIAWSAAGAFAAAMLRDPSLHAAPPWTLVLLGGAAVAALVAPARPFFYREVTGGRVLVFPLVACTRLLEGATAAGALQRVDGAGALPDPAGEWVSSRTPVDTRGNSPPANPAQNP